MCESASACLLLQCSSIPATLQKQTLALLMVAALACMRRRLLELLACHCWFSFLWLFSRLLHILFLQQIDALRWQQWLNFIAAQGAMSPSISNNTGLVLNQDPNWVSCRPVHWSMYRCRGLTHFSNWRNIWCHTCRRICHFLFMKCEERWRLEFVYWHHKKTAFKLLCAWFRPSSEDLMTLPGIIIPCWNLHFLECSKCNPFPWFLFLCLICLLK